MKNVPVLILLFITFLANANSSKVLLFTQSYNRPDLIKVQYRTLRHFLKDDFEFIVSNDAPMQEMCEQIE